MRANRVLVIAPAIVLAMGCAKGGAGTSGDGGGIDAVGGGDGAPPDGNGKPKLNPTFPPYGLTWTPTGDLGRAGGLTWTYSGIDRSSVSHIYWVFCDDPTQPCGISLDGPIDPATESWQYNATQSNRAAGKLVFTNTTGILLTTGTAQLSGRLTVNIAGPNNAPMFFDDVGSLKVPARDGIYGAEITGTGFVVTALAEVEDPATSTWAPYLDYYDGQMTPDTGDAGGNAFVSFGGSFYDD